MKLLILLMAVWNLITFLMMAIDKMKAKKDKQRISEKTLFLLSFLGGALFMYITMRLIRHKTLHKKFMIGLPVIILIHAVLTIVLLKYAPYIITV